MKQFSMILFVNIFMFLFVACAGQESESDTETENETKKECKSEIEDWDEFLGIPYGAKENKLQKYLGKFTGGEYTDDSTSFVYYFERVKRAPITVWVNAKTSDVETVFIEVLGLKDYFEDDVRAVKDEFNLTDCDTKWFGMTEDEIVEILGKPTKTDTSEDKSGKEVRSIFYDSEDLTISLLFKFYESQDNICSSISVYWFY